MSDKQSSSQKRLYTCERQQSADVPYGKSPIIKIRRTQEPKPMNMKPPMKVEPSFVAPAKPKPEPSESWVHLEQLLLFFHEQLEKRDTRKFFARPVTDDIAPGYSKIIRRPMDLSCMRQKIRRRKYATLQDYQADVRLMCHNAMTYNTPDTVYYQKARKILAYVEKAMQPLKAEAIAADLGFRPSRAQLGLPAMEEGEEEEEDEEEEEEEGEASGTTDGCAEFSPGPPRLSPETSAIVQFDEDVVDDATAAAIVEQATRAAREARERLEERYGGAPPQLAFLTISRPVSAGGICAREVGPSAPKARSVQLPAVEEVELFLGSGAVPLWQGDQVWRELEALNSKPREPLAAHLDWVLKGFSEDTARQLVSAYGDGLAVEYASSLLTFASQCGSFPRTLAHKCLNILTEGEHEKVQQLWRRRIPDAVPPAAPQPAAPAVRQTATVQPLQRSG